LELKTDNYSLAEEKRRHQQLIHDLTKRVEELEKQLSVAKTVNKINPLSLARNIANKVDHKLRSDSRGDDQHLVTENELLIRRIDAQEQEFRVTHNTLKEEIQTLVATNESLRDQLRAHVPVECDLGTNSSDNSRQLDDNRDMSSGGSRDQISYAILAEKERLELKICDLEEAVNGLRKENQSLVTKLDEFKRKCEDTERLQQELMDSTAMIERQNSLIEEMRAHKMEMEVKFKADCERIRGDHQSKVDSLEQRLKSKEETIDALKDRVEELADRLRDSEAIGKENEKLMNELVSYKDELSLCRSQTEETVERMNDEHRAVVDQLRVKHREDVEVIRQECEVYMSRIQDLESETSRLNQRIVDDIEDRKIHDKKGVLMVKELKRQLHSERKRADKLQERLHELLNESTASISSDIQHRQQNLSHNGGGNGDSSSVGSWSFMSAKDNNSSHLTSGHNRTLSLHSMGSDGGRDSTTSPVSPAPLSVTDGGGVARDGLLLERENNELVARITALQQEKWTLEERINQLELSVGALSDDIQRKTDIIQYYSMEGRADPPLHRYGSSDKQAALHSTDKLTVKRVMDFIKDRGDENMREINRKVQRMLEETLTKNMHLQQNLDSLSQEVVRLQGLVDSAGSNAINANLTTTIDNKG
jgi:chromosome segregation ATPase